MKFQCAFSTKLVLACGLFMHLQKIKRLYYLNCKYLKTLENGECVVIKNSFFKYIKYTLLEFQGFFVHPSIFNPKKNKQSRSQMLATTISFYFSMFLLSSLCLVSYEYENLAFRNFNTSFLRDTCIIPLRPICATTQLSAQVNLSEIYFI